MAPTLIALAGPSRSGKGTCASVLADGAQGLGLTTRERQLSGPGKQYVADAFRPGITEEEAIEWFDELKQPTGDFSAEVRIGWPGWEDGPFSAEDPHTCTLQEYLQRMLQGARDRWGSDFWTDKLIPLGDWHQSFLSASSGWVGVADLCLISDLRQVSEAERVKALGGYIIEMRRPELKHSYVTSSQHVTEQRFSDIRPDLVDYVIEGFSDHNDETFAELKARCWTCMSDFVRPLLEDRRS